MALVTHNIRSLVNGVSQQSPDIRLDNQVDEQINLASDIAFGLLKRNPVELKGSRAHDATWDPSEEDFMFTYTSTDGVIFSMGVKKSGVLYSFNEDLGTVTVETDIVPYLIHTDPKELSILETTDSVFILNKTVVTEEVESTAIHIADKVMLWLTNVTGGDKIRLEIESDDSVYSYAKEILVGSGSTPQDIMELIYDDVKVQPFIVFNHGRFGNACVLDLTDPTTPALTDSQKFTVKFFSVDGVSTGVNMVMQNDKHHPDAFIATSDILPPQIQPQFTVAFDNLEMVVKINPAGRRDTGYYLQSDSRLILWKEVTKLNQPTFKADTLPHYISKGGFEGDPLKIGVEEVPWAERGAGDSLIDKSPSFIGYPITDMLAFSDRLSFSSKDNLIFSEIGEPFNFFRTTTATLLRSDTVDLKMDSAKLGYKDIRSIFSLESDIFINTKDTQSKLVTTNDLDLSKSRFSHISSHSLGDYVSIPVRNSLMFPDSVDGFTNIVEFKLGDNSSYQGATLTAHISRYIKGDFIQAVYTEGKLILRTTDDPTILYVQFSFINEGNTLQNAWCKYKFPENIKHISNTGDTLHIVFEDIVNGQTLYTDLPLASVQNVEDTRNIADTEDILGYFPYLDFWTTDVSEILTGTISINKINGRKVTKPLVDDLDIITGVPFVETSVTLSEIVPRTTDNRGSTKLSFAKMMLRRIQCVMGFTGRLLIDITKKGRGTTSQKHMPKPTGILTIGREAVSDKDVKFSVNGRTQDVSIKIREPNVVEDGAGIFTPFNLLSLEYQAQLIKRGTRI